MKDKEFLQWFHDRAIGGHGENKSVDYMHKLRAIIAATDEDQETPSILSIFKPAKPVKWISVNDEMPEEEGLYLTFWNDGVIEAYVCELFSIPNKDNEMHFSAVGGTNVTHWMPLPDAPI